MMCFMMGGPSAALGQGCPEHGACSSNWGACMAHSAEAHSQVTVHRAKGPPIYRLLRNALEVTAHAWGYLTGPS